MARSATLSIKTTAWGLPMDTQVMRYSFPCTVMGASSTVSVSLTTGMFSATSSGAPMFTFTRITLPS